MSRMATASTDLVWIWRKFLNGRSFIRRGTKDLPRSSDTLEQTKAFQSCILAAAPQYPGPCCCCSVAYMEKTDGVRSHPWTPQFIHLAEFQGVFREDGRRLFLAGLTRDAFLRIKRESQFPFLPATEPDLASEITRLVWHQGLRQKNQEESVPKISSSPSRISANPGERELTAHETYKTGLK